MLVTVDNNNNGAANGNTILSSLGSSLTFGGSASNGPLQTGSFLTQGGPYNIVGSSLVVTPGAGVSGGTALASSYVAVEALGAGYIFGFGDHFAHDYFNNNGSNTNGQMHINLVESMTADGPVAGPSTVRLPVPLVLLGAGIVTLGAIARKKPMA